MGYLVYIYLMYVMPHIPYISPTYPMFLDIHVILCIHVYYTCDTLYTLGHVTPSIHLSDACDAPHTLYFTYIPNVSRYTCDTLYS